MYFSIFLLVLLGKHVSGLDTDNPCNSLLPGQFKCDTVKIDPATQAELHCRQNHTVQVPCRPAPGIVCDGETFDGTRIGFYIQKPCRYVNGKSFDVALLLSIFLGVFGVDRFYLGYPAIGVLKLCTLGFFLVFQLIDVILIATQVLKPADGSDYIIDYFGPRLVSSSLNNDTFYVEH